MQVEVYERRRGGGVRPVRVAHLPDKWRAPIKETPTQAAARLVAAEGLVERATETVHGRLQLHKPDDSRYGFWLEVLQILTHQLRAERRATPESRPHRASARPDA